MTEMKMLSTLPVESNMITKQVLEDALRSYENNGDLVVKDFEVSEAVGKGEAVLGRLFRVKVIAHDGSAAKEHHLVIKTDIAGDTEFGKYTRASTFCLREVETYNKIFPAMIELQERKNLVPLIPSVPDLVQGLTLGEDGMIIMKDLAQEGYCVTRLREGCDFNHCKLVMEEFAKFHALSYALKNRNPDKLNELFGFEVKENVFCDMYAGQFSKFIRTSLVVIVNLVKHRSHDADVVKRCEKLSSIDLAELFRNQPLTEEPFSTICLRDSMCRNMMFKYDVTANGPETPTGVKLLDFQTVCYSLPAADLAEFFYLSTTTALRQNHLLDLLQIYHNAFESYLKYLKFDFPEYSFDTLRSSFNKYKISPIMHALICLPFFLGKAEDLPDFSKDSDSSLTIDAFCRAVEWSGQTDRITDIVLEVIECDLL